MIAAFLLHTYGTSAAISTYIAVIAAISFTSALFLRDRSQDDYATNEGWVRDDRSPVAPASPRPPPDPRRGSSVEGSIRSPLDPFSRDENIDYIEYI